MRVIHSCRASVSTATTSDSVRRIFQLTHVSLLSIAAVINPNLVIPIGGQMRTVVDWWMARNAGTLSLGTWLPLADPDRADVTLFIEFTARHDHEFVAPGTTITARDLAYVPYLFMHTSGDAGPQVNTQLMWVRSLSPKCFCTTVTIVFSVVCCISIFRRYMLAIGGRQPPLLRRIC